MNPVQDFNYSALKMFSQAFGYLHIQDTVPHSRVQCHHEHIQHVPQDCLQLGPLLGLGGQEGTRPCYSHQEYGDWWWRKCQEWICPDTLSWQSNLSQGQYLYQTYNRICCLGQTQLPQIPPSYSVNN